MIRFLKQAAIPLFIGIACISNYVNADEYIFDTDTGFVWKNGLYVNNINGVRFKSTLMAGGIYQLKIIGDLNLDSGDSVVGRGSRGASIVVGNNANIHANSTIDFSSGKGGGGIGGIGGIGGAGGEGGEGGAGGREFKFVYFGTDNVLDGGGGAGNTPTCIGYCTANSGENGSRGESGSYGALGGVGHVGQDGQNGGVGLNNNHLSAGLGGENVEGIYTAGGQGGNYGLGGLYGFGGDRNAGTGTDGRTGSSGQIGDKGATALSGESGTGGQNWATGFTISGGSAGGGAAGGNGGGGGGGSGGSGTGGGGGGGGGEIGSFGSPIRGGDGGHGGAGADGATGGKGGTGQIGGKGGHGGGALEIIVMGELNAAGHFSAEGGDGQTAAGNRAGFIGDSGKSGSRGKNGEQRQSDGAGDPTYSGAGGDGGNGGSARTGSQGGTGGLGGTGGGGAGGTIKLVASVINSADATVDTSGGSSANGGIYSQGGDGRFITGSNASTGGPSILGARTTSTPTGTMGENPYNKLPSGLIPYIPNLVGGAETFGLLDGIDSQHSIFNSFLNGKPDNAIGALLRLDVGPLGYNYDFEGFDMLLFMSLSDSDLANPMLGIDTLGSDPNFLVNLMQGGFANDIGFGGLGDTIMDVLGSFNIFATLISEGEHFFNAKLGDSFLSSASLQNGEIAYLTGSLIDDDDGGDVDFDNPNDNPDPTEVPEPLSILLMLIALAILLFRQKEIAW
jgi:hypothetical protein